MANLNKVMLMGNLTRHPELKQVGDTSVCNLRLAVNRNWSDSKGQRHQETTYVDMEAWGKKAEVLDRYLDKGSPLFVEGRLQLDQWTDKGGNPRSKLKIFIENFQFVGHRREPAGHRNEQGKDGEVDYEEVSGISFW